MSKKENKGGFITSEQLEKDLDVKSNTSNNPGHQQGNTTDHNQPQKNVNDGSEGNEAGNRSRESDDV